MDISALNVQHLDSSYVPFSSASVPESQTGATGAFERLLKKAQEKDSSTNSFSPARKNPPPIDKNDRLYELCMDLETFMIKNLLKSMRSTIQKSKFIDPGFAGEMYEDMLYDEYAKTFARNAGLGFAEMAYRELSGYR